MKCSMFIQSCLDRKDGQGDDQVFIGGGPGKGQLEHLTHFYNVLIFIYSSVFVLFMVKYFSMVGHKTQLNLLSKDGRIVDFCSLTRG